MGVSPFGRSAGLGTQQAQQQGTTALFEASIWGFNF